MKSVFLFFRIYRLLVYLLLYTFLLFSSFTQNGLYPYFKDLKEKKSTKQAKNYGINTNTKAQSSVKNTKANLQNKDILFFDPLTNTIFGTTNDLDNPNEIEEEYQIQKPINLLITPFIIANNKEIFYGIESIANYTLVNDLYLKGYFKDLDNFGYNFFLKKQKMGFLLQLSTDFYHFTNYHLFYLDFKLFLNPQFKVFIGYKNTKAKNKEQFLILGAEFGRRNFFSYPRIGKFPYFMVRFSPSILPESSLFITSIISYTQTIPFLWRKHFIRYQALYGKTTSNNFGEEFLKKDFLFSHTISDKEAYKDIAFFNLSYIVNFYPQFYSNISYGFIIPSINSFNLATIKDRYIGFLEFSVNYVFLSFPTNRIKLLLQISKDNYGIMLSLNRHF